MELSQVPTITVPDSSYQLNYRSVQAETDNGIRFLVQRDGVTYQMEPIAVMESSMVMRPTLLRKRSC
jgi:hypothetical protein